MEMQICIKGIMIVVILAIVAFGALILIMQVSLKFMCKKKIEATLIDVEISKQEKGTKSVAVPHESRYSKYSYTYKPKKEYTYKKVYTYTYKPVYQYEYDNQSFTSKPMNMLDYIENRTFERKNYKIGQRCYIYINPKHPDFCITKRFSLCNAMMLLMVVGVFAYLSYIGCFNWL